MTLNITRFLSDSLRYQTKISHFISDIQIGKRDKLRTSYKNIIESQYGKIFLNDADYIAITKISEEASVEKFKKKFIGVLSRTLNMEIQPGEAKYFEHKDVDDGIEKFLFAKITFS